MSTRVSTRRVPVEYPREYPLSTPQSTHVSTCPTTTVLFVMYCVSRAFDVNWSCPPHLAALFYLGKAHDPIHPKMPSRL